SDFQRGVTLTGYDRDAYARPEARKALRATVSLGADWITLTPAWYQDKASSSRMRPSPERTPSAESVEEIIDEARDLHLDVTLKPHLNLLHGGFRGEISPKHVDAWFRSYGRMIDFYADLASRTGVKQLVVGTELEGVSMHARRWRKLIRHVRERFPGRLTYAANYGEAPHVRFWDALDLIGVDAYYALTDEPDPDVSKLVEAWKQP